MTRILVTGSTTGLGLAAAEELLREGHDVVLHARSEERARAVQAFAVRGVPVVIGDLGTLDQVRSVAEQVADIGGVDSVIHNAAVYIDDRRVVTPDGHARTFAVNVLAPYVLTALIPSERLVYLTSGMHRSGSDSLDDLDWEHRRWSGVQAYCDSKLLVVALAFAVSRRDPHRRTHAVDPGWVPTRMGGPGAPDDLELGHQTQAWLAVTDDPDTDATDYWYHRERQTPAEAALDPAVQDGLIERLVDMTGTQIPAGR
jgi:NAD(P)-dependent dehydrogenase (short-subunit alcohol dehydrogenase family)